MNDRTSDWIADTDAVCVSVITGVDARGLSEHVAGAGAVEFSDIGSASEWASQALNYDRHWFATGQCDDYSFIWEDNGWLGSTPAVAESLSHEGVFTSMYWDVNSHMTFTYARAGTIVAQFDPLRAPADAIWPALLEAGGVRIFDEEWQVDPRLSGMRMQAQIMKMTSIVSPTLLAAPGVRIWGNTF